MTPGSDDRAVLSLDHVSKAYTRDLRRGRRNGLSAIRSELRREGAADRDELRPGEFWAVHDVSLTVSPGEALGIVGVNGAGKSTLLRLMAGITRPTSGEISGVASAASLLDANAGFNPVLTGRENATVAYTLFCGEPPPEGMVDEIIAYAGVEAAADHPLRTYSSGMRVRLGFSVMVFVDPDVLIIDEALAVGDTGFQLQCLEHLHSHARAGGSLVFVSHSMWAFQHVANRGLLLDAGEVVCDGTSEEVADQYLAMIRDRSAAADGPDVLEREKVIRRRVERAPDPDEPEADGSEGDRTARRLDDGFYGTRAVGDQRPVHFVDVRIEDGEGGEPAVGEPLQITFELHSTEHFPSATLGFMVWTGDLTICVFADLSHDVVGQDVGGFELHAGQATLGCRVDPNPLLHGQYAVRAAVYDGGTGDILGMTGFEDTPWWFDLAEPELPDGGVAPLRGTLRPLRTVAGQIQK